LFFHKRFFLDLVDFFNAKGYLPRLLGNKPVVGRPQG